MPIIRRSSALFALLYLLLAAGGEALVHGADGPAAVQAVAHLHDAEGGDHDCPPPPHDENHCPACKLTGLRFLPSVSAPGELAGGRIVRATRPPGDEPAPPLRSHAPTRSRAPPLG